MLRKLSVTVAALAMSVGGVVAGAAPSQAAPAPSQKAAAGDVCFFTDTNFGGDSWCYAPPGYVDVPSWLQDDAESFDARNLGQTVYAIDWTRTTCFYRTIRPGDWGIDWSWGSRIDGMADTTMSCAAG
ncbi:hypothetical protein ACWC10_29790 [Streptomyces sp. NPDC001595]|uniref:hypothetical protein n=1 Tax=Streptomyces sp. NPDC001532 TaxID=3154520 RepID=UPI00331E1CF2